MKIRDVRAFQVFDSRGNPTLEAEVVLDNGVSGRGLVPAGASTGQYEAHELRDGDPQYFGGKSVRRAIDNVHREIAPCLHGRDVFRQGEIDHALIGLDGTPDKSRLGANAILGVSLAVADAGAKCRGEPLYAYLGEGKGELLPLPQIQLIGGGAHAGWRVDIQDFLVVATGARSYEDALEMCARVYHATGELLDRQGKRFGVADEGGFWPELSSNEAGLELCVRGIERAGYKPGDDVCLALDIAASDLYDPEHGGYHFRSEGRFFETGAFAELLGGWCSRYPVLSIEDPMADTDWSGWRALYTAIGEKVQVVGDDLFTTNLERIHKGIERNVANAVLIKLNQVGTLSETLEAIRATERAGWSPIVSARSGETEDVFIAHLAVASNAGQIKVGAFARGERMAKWNELLRIARQLGTRARYEGARYLPRGTDSARLDSDHR